MNAKQYLKQVLNSENITNLLPNKRVFFLHATSPKPPYIEYEVVNEYAAAHSEGNENFTTYIVQVDIFSTGDYTDIENTVKKVMFQNGFSRDVAEDLYEDDTGLYHKAMRFNISLPTQFN